MKKAVVILPTYNESQNIAALIDAVLAANPEIDVLVVDDDSPDGTGQIADGWAARSPRVFVLHRRGRRRGRGLAGREGFRFALDHGYPVVLEMDADFSHPPELIPTLLKELGHCDVVIASRDVPGSSVIGRSIARRWVSRLANAYIRWVLGLSVRDCTSGFRGFRREALVSLGLERMRSVGPSIVEEILYACSKRGCRIREIPVAFRNRRRGKSKLSAFKLIKTFLMIPRIRLGL